MVMQEYWKKKLVNQNLEVEYSSESDKITIRYDKKLKNGVSIGIDYLRIHPSYIEPLYELMKQVIVKDQSNAPKQEQGERYGKF